MADAFNRAKHQLLDRAMRDGRLTPASRLVFYEIIQHVNRVSGDAWPSEVRLADRLDIDVKTVKRALPPLTLYGYIEVKKSGRHNTYRPVFDGPAKGDKLSPNGGAQGAHVERAPPGAQGAHLERAPPNSIGDNLSEDRGQFVHSIGDKNGPLSSLREPHKENLAKNTTSKSTCRSRAREGLPTDPLASKADDGKIHMMLMQELGEEVVDALYAIDGGRPLNLLTVQRRERQLTPIETSHARSLAVGELRRRRGGAS